MKKAPGIKVLQGIVSGVIFMLLSFYTYMGLAYHYWTPKNFVHTSTLKHLALAPISGPEGSGARLFQTTGCALCHGLNGTGGVTDFRSDSSEDSLPTLLGISETQDKESLADIINHGQIEDDGPPVIYSMPPFKDRLTAAQVNALSDYLLTLPADPEEE